MGLVKDTPSILK